MNIVMGKRNAVIPIGSENISDADILHLTARGKEPDTCISVVWKQAVNKHIFNISPCDFAGVYIITVQRNKVIVCGAFYIAYNSVFWRTLNMNSVHVGAKKIIIKIYILNCKTVWCTKKHCVAFRIFDGKRWNVKIINTDKPHKDSVIVILLISGKPEPWFTASALLIEIVAVPNSSANWNIWIALRSFELKRVIFDNCAVRSVSEHHYRIRSKRKRRVAVDNQWFWNKIDSAFYCYTAAFIKLCLKGLRVIVQSVPVNHFVSPFLCI